MPAFAPDELLKQFHNNQSLWVARLATGETHPLLPNPHLMRAGNTLAMRPGRSGVIMLPVSEAASDVVPDHDAALTWLRRSAARDVLVWSMTPDVDLDVEFLAQGYQIGFEPWWMTRDLTKSVPSLHHTVRLATADDIEQLATSDIPYVIRDQVATTQSLISDPSPGVLWLVAIDKGEPVGHAIVNLLDDHAGLFNVGVSGRHRHRGIGTSLTLGAMRIARDHGAYTMNLNSTPAGKRMYERIGFVQFGIGQTWTRSGGSVHLKPTPSERALMLAIGRGDVANIQLDPLLHRRLSNGLTPQQVAARFGQQQVLLHLIDQGLVPEIISLWDAGLREEALAATRNAQARELCGGINRAYPLHHAIERGAGTLVMALIDAGANLTARDGEFNATPLDWAHACNKPTIARIIRQAGGR